MRRCLAFTVVLVALGCGIPGFAADVHTFEREFSEVGLGCGNFEVAVWATDHRSAVVIRGSRQNLGLSTEEKTFTLGGNLSLIVGLVEYSEKGQSCEDVFGPHQLIESVVWSAIGGTATLWVSPERVERQDYNLSLILKDVVLESQMSSGRAKLKDQTWQDIRVGPSMRNKGR